MRPHTLSIAILFLIVLTAPQAAFSQEALSIRPPKPGSASLPFQVRPAAGGLEVTAYTGVDRRMMAGDMISWVATPDSNDTGTQVTTAADLNTAVLARKDAKGEVALWTTRKNGEQDWVFVKVGSPSTPGSPPAAASGFVELPEKLGGISLLPGFHATSMPPGHHGEVWGGISGPDGMNIQYSIWPVREGKGPRTSGDFVSDAERLAEENRQWFREQVIGSDLVQIALSNEDQLMVSYPGRGINMSVAINGTQQLADALLIMLSVPNEERHVAWADAETMLSLGDVKSVTQFHSLTVMIRMSNGLTYRTKEPNIDVVFDVLRKCGKYDKVGKITE